jgi:hypothetical protein
MRPRRRAAVVLLGAAVGCKREHAITSCGDDLHGVWRTTAGERWMILDNGPTLEAYPLFDDSVPSGAPRVIDLQRRATLTGEIKRRFMLRADACEARAPLEVTACHGNTLELVRGNVSPPLTFVPCTWPAPTPTRAERWTRE